MALASTSRNLRSVGHWEDALKVGECAVRVCTQLHGEGAQRTAFVRFDCVALALGGMERFVDATVAGADALGFVRGGPDFDIERGPPIILTHANWLVATGGPDEALKVLDSLPDLAYSMLSKRTSCAILTTKGSALRQLSRAREAVDCHRQALRLLQEVPGQPGNPNADLDLEDEIIHGHQELGKSLWRMAVATHDFQWGRGGPTEEAVRCFRKAHEMWGVRGKRAQPMQSLYEDLGTILGKLNRNREAADVWRDMLELCKQHISKCSCALAQTTLSASHLVHQLHLAGDNDAVSETLNDAYALLRDAAERFDLDSSDVLFRLAEDLTQRTCINHAFHCWYEAIDDAVETHGSHSLKVATIMFGAGFTVEEAMQDDEDETASSRILYLVRAAVKILQRLDPLREVEDRIGKLMLPVQTVFQLEMTALEMKGRLECRMGFHNAAIKSFRSALAIVTENLGDQHCEFLRAVFFMHLAKSYLALERPRAALKAMDDCFVALRRVPYNVAALHGRRGISGDGESDASLASRPDSTSMADFLMVLGDVLLRLGKYANAKKVFEEVELSLGHVPTELQPRLAAMAASLEAAGQPAEAVRKLRKEAVVEEQIDRSVSAVKVQARFEKIKELLDRNPSRGVATATRARAGV